MAHVGVAGLFHGVVVHVNDAVQVARGVVGDVVEKLVVEHTVARVHELGQGDGGQVADGHFVLGGVLHDLRAEVGGADGAEVLLVGFLVGSVLVEHVGRTGFDLCFDDFVPDDPGRHRFAGHASALVVFVHGLEFSTVNVLKTGALVGAEEGPVAVVFHALHEQVGRPHGVEEVASAHLFLAVVLLEVEELEDVGVPRFKVHGDGTLALATALVDVASRVVEDTKHGDDAVGGAVGALDVGTLRADVVDGKTDATSRLRNQSALLQGVVNAVEGIVLHRQQEARGHLRHGGAGVEQGWGGVGEVALAHQVVGVEGFLDVGVVNAHRHAHQHVLRSLSHLAVEFEQVGALEGLESEVVVVVVAVVVDVIVEHLGVRHDDLIHFLRDERCVLVGFRVDVLSEVGDDIGEGRLGRTVEVVHTDACGQAAVIGVMRSERCSGFSSELIQFTGGDAVVEAFDGQLGDVAGVNPNGVEAFGQFHQFFLDGIESHIFSLALPVDNLHGHDSILLRCSFECVISFFGRVRFKSLRPRKIAVGHFRGKHCP